MLPCKMQEGRLTKKIYVELSSKVYDNLLDPRHECLVAADIKSAYHMVPFYEDDRHSFAFTYNLQSSSRHGFPFNSPFHHQPRSKQTNKQAFVNHKFYRNIKDTRFPPSFSSPSKSIYKKKHDTKAKYTLSPFFHRGKK